MSGPLFSVVTADCRPRRLGDDPINCGPSNAQCSGQPLGRPQREPRALRAGKTFFLEASGQLAVEQGLHVAWFTPEDLGGLIRRHRADDTVAKAIRAILRAELIVVEDIGLYRSHRTPPKASTASSTLRLRRGLGLAGTVGLAQLQFGESSDDVIVRADADLCRQRHQRSH